MAVTPSLPSRFASAPLRRPEPVTDFGMISLDAVEKMLRDPTSETAPLLGNDYVPPLVFSATGTTPAPRPQAVPVAAPAAPRPPAAPGAWRFADLLLPGGRIDTDAVYRYAQVPAVPLSAELLLQALANLPADIPERARPAALQVTVGSLTQAVGIAVESVIADARMRHTRLAQFWDALVAEQAREAETLHRAAIEIEQAIAAKNAELAALRADLLAMDAVADVTRRDCETRLAQLQEVIACLDTTPTVSAPMVSAQGDELPAFLRDDSVRRILGITDDGA